MRKTPKSQLHNSLLKLHPHVEKPNADCCVVDGGAALHHSPWVPPQCTYNDLAEQFIKYLVSRGKNYEIHVVFDGYTLDLSTKNSEQEQRQKSGKVSADVTVSADGSTCLSVKKAEFLLNQSNKSLLIKLLCQRLTEHGIGNSQCDGDADVLIVETAISIANTGKSVVVASDDTDVFIMLLKHVKTAMTDVFYTTLMRDCKSSNTKPVPMWWHVQSIVTMLPIPYDLILSVHAWGGCDTTSATYGKGKMKLMEMLKSNNMQETVSCFRNVEATQEEIDSAGNSVMLCIFNGKSETLTALRYAEWRKMVLGKKELKPESLPPTDRAVHFHALRVHLQVCQ